MPVSELIPSEIVPIGLYLYSDSIWRNWPDTARVLALTAIPRLLMAFSSADTYSGDRLSPSIVKRYIVSTPYVSGAVCPLDSAIARYLSRTWLRFKMPSFITSALIWLISPLSRTEVLSTYGIVTVLSWLRYLDWLALLVVLLVASSCEPSR